MTLAAQARPDRGGGASRDKAHGPRGGREILREPWEAPNYDPKKELTPGKERSLRAQNRDCRITTYTRDQIDDGSEEDVLSVLAPAFYNHHCPKCGSEQSTMYCEKVKGQWKYMCGNKDCQKYDSKNRRGHRWAVIPAEWSGNLSVKGLARTFWQWAHPVGSGQAAMAVGKSDRTMGARFAQIRDAVAETEEPFRAAMVFNDCQVDVDGTSIRRAAKSEIVTQKKIVKGHAQLFACRQAHHMD